MLYSNLVKNASFLKSKEWKLYILLKTFCEYLQAPKKSDYQIDVQTQILHDYIAIRLSLINDEDVKPLSPKHTFSLHYSGVHNIPQLILD